MTSLILLIPLLPLFGFLFNVFFGKKINSEKFTGYFSSLLIFFAFVLSLVTLFILLDYQSDSRCLSVNIINWITTGKFSVDFSFLIDPLSVCMMLVVTGVGFLIHLYSIGYMHNDSDFNKFFAYMNLFIFAMLILVMSDNFLFLFLGWEGVGLCSYLLIGFWYEKNFTGDAAKKAFITNRIGDFGFLIAMFLIFSKFDSLNIVNFINGISSYQINDIYLIAVSLLLFLGATGKSAQIPLFVWLPDAMAGPTPVSALIHAATMVTAGVYLVARCSLLYSLSPVTLNVILIIGILTAILAASIAIKQNDIKKILAYSTISQLGFMFIALGCFSFVAAIFHLITHAFFKALLFLGSGSVIHSLKDEQDIYRMGGLKVNMKITYFTFLIGTLAISGIPPLSGFFSKDEILFKAFTNKGLYFFIPLLLTALLTAFYMFRLFTLTFSGQPRYNTSEIHPHESPKTITITLIILAFLSLTGGIISLPHYTGFPNILEEWLSPVFSASKNVINSYHTEISHSLSTEFILIVTSIALIIISIVMSVIRYTKNAVYTEGKGFMKILENKYYVDEIYNKIIINPVLKLSDRILNSIFDIKIIDGFVNAIANYINRLSSDWRKMQTGIIQDYAAITVAGILLIILYVLFA